MELMKYSFIPVSVALVVSIFFGIQPDPTHTCDADGSTRYCFDISGGLHTRCYLNPEKDTWDYCKGGWDAMAEWASPITKGNIEYKSNGDNLEIWKKEKTYLIPDLLSEQRHLQQRIDDRADETFDMILCHEAKKDLCKIDAEQLQISIKDCLAAHRFECDVEEDVFNTQKEFDVVLLNTELTELNDLVGVIE